MRIRIMNLIIMDGIDNSGLRLRYQSTHDKLAGSNLLMIKESFDKHDLKFLKNAYSNFQECGARVMMVLLEEGYFYE